MRILRRGCESFALLMRDQGACGHVLRILTGIDSLTVKEEEGGIFRIINLHKLSPLDIPRTICYPFLQIKKTGKYY